MKIRILLNVRGPVITLCTLLVGPGGRFLYENWPFIYGGIVFIPKWTCCIILDIYGASNGPINIQNGQWFHNEKRSKRSGTLSRNLAPKHANYGSKVALGLNDEKIVGFFHLQTCSYCPDFCLWVGDINAIQWTPHPSPLLSSFRTEMYSNSSTITNWNKETFLRQVKLRAKMTLATE